MSTSPLLIGIADTCKADMASVGINYTNAVARAGHTPVLLPRTTQAEVIADMIARLDALLLPGGGSDVDPALYGAEPSPYMGEIVPERDAFEYALIRAAVSRRLPILGICRGIQVLNVYFGGTLIQDIGTELDIDPSVRIEHQRPDKEWEGVHPIQIRPDSRLHQLLGTDSAMVNSTHHQSVCNVAPGFIVSATSPDGVVEAIESAQLPIIGVQFHPERLAVGTDTLFTRLFSLIDRY